MSDIQSFFQYYLTLQALGLSVWPLTKRLFPNFPDRGWAFTKILGILLVSWVVWLLGSIRAAPFARTTIIAAVIGVAILNWLAVPVLRRLKHQAQSTKSQINSKFQAPNNKRRGVWNLKFGICNLFGACDFEFGILRVILFEELLFLASFAFWTWIRGFSPDIRGLEKFMDYGFVLSILRSKYFPPLDHFLSGNTINYYYLGHLIAALLSRLSGVAPNIAFNLQIANLFGLTMLGSFSIGAALAAPRKTSEVSSSTSEVGELAPRKLIFAGLLTAIFVTIIGNLHTIINIFREGQSYWYPTATRLIPNTIHEFPIYSFVVADLHGHVSDIPIVLLVIGLVVSYFFTQTTKSVKSQISIRQLADKTQNLSQSSKLKSFALLTRFCTLPFALCTFLALAIGAMFATNTWDFLVYFLLTGLVFLYLNYQPQKSWLQIFIQTAKTLVPVFILSILFFLPYHLTVKSIAKGIGLVHDWSPPWLWFQMWGFHALLVFFFLIWIFRKRIRLWIKPESVVQTIARTLGVKIQIPSTKFQTSTKHQAPNFKQKGVLKFGFRNWNLFGICDLEFGISDSLVLLFIVLSALLIILPEIIYFKDIYPTHYRANTMFKFFYQAWILLGIATSYGMLRIIGWIKKNKSFFGKLLLTFYFLLFTFVMLYPYIALRSSTGLFKNNKGLDGTKFLEVYFPADAKAIDWLNENVSGQPTIVEAVGESYTDYSRICSNTGLPCVLGWPVHEWLWRGSYDEAGRRTADVQTLYETDSVAKARELLEKYKVDYVYIGGMEKEKYKNLNSEKFAQLGEVVYENEEVKVFKIFNF